MFVVAFSLSKVEVNCDRGTWAIERRDRGREDPAESLRDAMGVYIEGDMKYEEVIQTDK